MGNEFRVTRVRQSGIQGLHQTQSPIRFPQEQDPAIAGNLTAVKVRFDLSTIKAWKS
jgi:hypothetical protein